MKWHKFSDRLPPDGANIGVAQQSAGEWQYEHGYVKGDTTVFGNVDILLRHWAGTDARWCNLDASHNECPRVAIRMECSECNYPLSEAKYEWDGSTPHLPVVRAETGEPLDLVHVIARIEGVAILYADPDKLDKLSDELHPLMAYAYRLLDYE